MSRLLTFFLLAGSAICQMSSSGAARDLLNQGVQAYKANRYLDAQQAFEQAVALEPANTNALLYLATTHMVQWIPGVNDGDNVSHRDQARSIFEKVLAIDSSNPLALASLASIAYNSAQAAPPEGKRAALEEARRWNLRRLDANGKETEAMYYLGVISWAECFPEIQRARVDAGLRPEDPGPLPDWVVTDQLRSTCSQPIDEGIGYLRKCLEIDVENDDAMSYMNLSLRLKANLAPTLDGALSLIAEAETWANKSLDTKRAKTSRGSGPH